MSMGEEVTRLPVLSADPWQQTATAIANTPPSSPTTGMRVIVGTAGTGAFSGHNNAVATWGGSAWSFFTPLAGFTVYLTTSATYYTFGGSTWTQKIALESDVLLKDVSGSANFQGATFQAIGTVPGHSLDIQSARPSGEAVTGPHGAAFGSLVTVSATASLGLGYHAAARVDQTCNIGSAIINRKDGGEIGASFTSFQSFAGVEVVLMSQQINLLTAGTSTKVEIDIPTGATFFVDEVGVITTGWSGGGFSTPPFVSFGNGTDPIKYEDGVPMDAGTEGYNKRQAWKSTWGSGNVVIYDGEQTLVAEVAVAGVASDPPTSNALGRFYFKGILMELQ